jgi:hypothetical protein
MFAANPTGIVTVLAILFCWAFTIGLQSLAANGAEVSASLTTQLDTLPVA